MSMAYLFYKDALSFNILETKKYQKAALLAFYAPQQRGRLLKNEQMRCHRAGR